ncbi:GNAT family N-acetyltransferase [Muriicola soli]|uniref:GNAT family N-acetyltransferase n=1 Tax=Muriicola soli TaxID=2507538 RepID=A0A411ECV9_9FLAO|nr:GNAT family N-acetyltransferase [Muriicola soli]QBA65363.1 GNAT family N-acetyltransferase [Muriicola soli]
MEIAIKSFKKLSKQELYRILQLRNEIFIVEQNCPYLDLDNLDEKAYHALGIDASGICAYTRIFKAGDYFEEPSIGRVAVSEDCRGRGFGKEIMQASVDYIDAKWPMQNIVISAQLYLKKFYQELGFETIEEEYLEDDIPHIKMKRRWIPQSP